jgi:hypothetical protein
VNLQHHRDVEFEAAAADDDIRPLCGRDDEVKKTEKYRNVSPGKKRNNPMNFSRLNCHWLNFEPDATTM